MTAQAAVKIRVNVAGFHGAAVSLFCAYDPGTDVLLIARESAYEPGARDGFLKVTTLSSDAAFDTVFKDEDTKEAITAYFALTSTGLMTLADKVQRLSPTTKIERDGMDEGGAKYRIAPDIGCGQVAVLVACWCAQRQRRINSMQSAMRDFELLGI